MSPTPAAPMDHSTFAQLLDNYRTSGSAISTGTPVKVLLKSGDLVDVEDVQYSFVDGGQIRVIAGPTEDDEADDEFQEEDVDADEEEEEKGKE